MAERPQDTNSNVLCRFFVIGSCRSGSNCQFSHDASTAMNVCRFFLRGTCNFGNQCRYDHSLPGSHGRKEHRSGNRPTQQGTKRTNDSKQSESDIRDLLNSISSLRVEAPEFVPSGSQASSSSVAIFDKLCAEFIIDGQCSRASDCPYVHGLKCDFCLQYVLLPNDEESNVQHRQYCIAEHEKEMQVAFTIARSSVMQCGICMETVMDKQDSNSSRFGILSNCRHCFCLDCIRMWRRQEEFDSRNTRACPQCRVVSNFVIPSPFWVEDEMERSVLMDSYKSSLKKRNCRYHDASRNRECPFGNQCFYRHSNPDGTEDPGDSPRTVRRRIRRNNRNRRRLRQRNDAERVMNLSNLRRGLHGSNNYMSPSFFFDYDDLTSDEEFDLFSLLGNDIPYGPPFF